MDINEFEIIEDIETNSKINKGVRSYNWCLVTYNAIENLQPLFDKICKFAYIHHDRDLCKNEHYHIMIYNNREISFNQLKEILSACENPNNQNTFFQVVKNKKSCFEYLTHKNNPDKFQYDESDIVSNDINFFSMVKNEKNIVELLDDIIQGFSMREMAKKWGRDFILNRQKYVDYALEMAESERIYKNHMEIKKSFPNAEIIE